MSKNPKTAVPKKTVKNGKVYGDALSAAEKKRIVTQMKKDKHAKKIPKSAQQTIPYVEMCRDGICKVNSRLYTKTIRFYDINYQLAQNEDKTAIFENWCDFLNYFDSTIFVQLSFINQRTNINEFKKSIRIPEQDDAFNDIRSEYSQMLQDQLTKGNNGLLKHKYITFGIEADSLRAAKAKLERIEADILNNFKTLGVKTEPMSGYERLKVLHDVFNMDTNEPFRFSFDMVARTGLSTKDFVAPTSFDFREGKYFKMGKTIGAVSFLQILAPELNDRMLSDFLEMDSNITVNFHIRTIDQAQAIKRIKMKITDLDKMKIEEQKKAVRSGYDMEIIPSDLATFGGEAKRLLQDLQMRNERILTEEVVVETRYRTETRYDSEGNPYPVEVPYDYYICYVTLENFNLSHVPVYIMSEDELSLYSAYMSTLGNREDLFGDSEYVDKYITNPPADYDVPAEYLDDATFATLLSEAEKYIGYPYVWGGSNPSTSFDCSGFVSYVLTNSGLCNTGRLGAQGLYNICTPVSDPQPGDLVFFVGTYDTPGVSHVGIYVGDQVMLHCGDPIQYTSIASSYWQNHFYAYGRPPY